METSVFKDMLSRGREALDPFLSAFQAGMDVLPMEYTYVAIQAFLIIYVFIYNSMNFFMVVLAFFSVRMQLKKHHITDPELLYHSPHSPVISILVPAYNEARTIVQSLYSLLNLHYPHFEIIVTNDGSDDRTLEVLKKEFKLIRKDSEYLPVLGTAKVRGLYESRMEKSESVLRLMVIDKENGGRSDALNAGINAAKGDFVCTVDADSILEENALLQTIQPIVEDREQVIACGGQVAIANGCVIRDGRVIKTGLPKKALPMFQVIEYIRSFTGGRTAFEKINSLLILSGAFSIIQRGVLLEVGGFLTRYLTTRIGIEYCGKGSHTVCEDMEVIVRIWRYLYDKGRLKKITFSPHPICWTEAPEKMRDLGSQRDRWYRGLCEILWFHRLMLFNPRFGRIGLFAMPYQFFFEFLGPLMEFIGYITIPLLWVMGKYNLQFVFLFFLSATVYGTFISIVSVLLGLWNESAHRRGEITASLFRYGGLWAKIRLFTYALLSCVGYRQVLLFYQMRGFVGFLKKEKGWQKFERQGFELAEG
ncbi:glycosyltransferase [Fibrobacterota bacterium]